MTRVFSFSLYGGIAHQAIIYYQAYPDDRPWLKALVSVITHIKLCALTCNSITTGPIGAVSSVLGASSSYTLSLTLYPSKVF